MAVEQIGIGEFSRRSRLSAKALRLYDELGLLRPASVDERSGYRYYEPSQLSKAWLIASLRQLRMPLAEIGDLLTAEPAAIAEGITAFWGRAEAEHLAKRELASFLVERLRGKRSTMPTVACREVPERTLLCLKRNIYEEGAWALGKEFVKIFRDRPLPRMQGRIGAAFSIYWGTVSADSDGPIEWCRPIPSEGAAETAANYPELEMRVEPAHREAFVPIEPGVAVADWQAAFQSLEDWREEHGILTKDLTISPEDLGIRITYLASGLPSDAAVPDCDLAVPFA